MKRLANEIQIRLVIICHLAIVFSKITPSYSYIQYRTDAFYLCNELKYVQM